MLLFLGTDFSWGFIYKMFLLVRPPVFLYECCFSFNIAWSTKIWVRMNVDRSVSELFVSCQEFCYLDHVTWNAFPKKMKNCFESVNRILNYMFDKIRLVATRQWWWWLWWSDWSGITVDVMVNGCGGDDTWRHARMMVTSKYPTTQWCLMYKIRNGTA